MLCWRWKSALSVSSLPVAMGHFLTRNEMEEQSDSTLLWRLRWRRKFNSIRAIEAHQKKSHRKGMRCRRRSCDSAPHEYIEKLWLPQNIPRCQDNHRENFIQLWKTRIILLLNEIAQQSRSGHGSEVWFISSDGLSKQRKISRFDTHLWQICTMVNIVTAIAHENANRITAERKTSSIRRITGVKREELSCYGSNRFSHWESFPVPTQHLIQGDIGWSLLLEWRRADHWREYPSCRFADPCDVLSSLSIGSRTFFSEVWSCS